VEDGSHKQFKQYHGWKENEIKLMLWKSGGGCCIVHGHNGGGIVGISMRAVGSYMQESTRPIVFAEFAILGED